MMFFEGDFRKIEIVPARANSKLHGIISADKKHHLESDKSKSLIQRLFLMIVVVSSPPGQLLRYYTNVTRR